MPSSVVCIALTWANLTPANAVEPTVASVPAVASAKSAYSTTVTALRLARPLPDVPASVTVISRDEIDSTAALGSDDLLRNAPSAATFRRTPSLTADPTAQGLNLRGLGPSGVSRALVLLDGIPVNDPFGGWVYWRALPRLSIERMEIVPGGASALYGNYGLGGVVALTSRPIARRLEADAAGGSLGLLTGGIAAAGRRGRLGGAIEAEFLKSDGYVPVVADKKGLIDRPAASRHGAVHARGAWQMNDAATVAASVRAFDEDQNGGTEFTTARARTLDFGLALNADSARLGRLQTSVFGGIERFRQQRARIMPDRSTEFLSAAQNIPSGSQGASIVWHSPVLQAAGVHALAVGADVRRVTTNAVEVLYPALVAPATLVERRVQAEQSTGGVFASELYDPRPWLALFGALRLDIWRNGKATSTRARGDGAEESSLFQSRAETMLSPRAGIVLRPAEKTRIRASAYRAFRAPTLNELYRPFQVGTVLTAANENLKAETVLGAELGVEQLFGSSAVRATGFWNELDDPIVNVTLAMPGPGGAARQRQNLGRATVRGFELSGDVRLPWHLTALAAYTLAEARVTDAPAHDELRDKLLAQDPVHRARVALTYAHPHRATLGVQVRAQSQQFEDDINTLPMEGFALVDLFAAVPLRWGVELFASAQNLLNQPYLVGRAGVDTVGPPLVLLAGLRRR